MSKPTVSAAGGAMPASGSTKTKTGIAGLSFVADRDGKTLPKPTGRQLPRCFWHVKPSGDLLSDDKIGQCLALEYLAFEESDKEGPGLLQHIVTDMPRDLTGVEISFLSLVAWAAGAGAERARQIVAYWDSCKAGEGGAR
jgi:hypothetical protein